MKFRRVIVYGGIVATVLAGCYAPTEKANETVVALTEGLTNLSLSDVPLTSPESARQFARQIEPLSGFDVDIHAGEVDYKGEHASVPLDWSWHIGDHEWAYQTRAHLALADDGDGQHGWQVEWTSETLHPELSAEGEFHLEYSAPERAEVRGADAEVIVTDRPVEKYGLDKTLIDDADLEEAAAKIADATGVDAERFIATAKASGPKAFVEAIAVRPEDVEEFVDPGFADLAGAQVVSTTQPLAPTRTFARELLGSVGPATKEIIEKTDGKIRPGELAGLSGLNAAYDAQLRGTPSVAITISNPGACTQWPKCDEDERTIVAEWAGKQPKSLNLTLNVSMQEAAVSRASRNCPGAVMRPAR